MLLTVGVFVFASSCAVPARAQSEARVIAAMPREWVWRTHLSIAAANLAEGHPRDALAHAAKAHERLAAGHVLGKIVLRIR